MNPVFDQKFVDRVLAYQGAPRTIPDLLDPGLIEKILEAVKRDDVADVAALIAEDNGYGDPLLYWLIKQDLSGTERFVQKFESRFDIFMASFFGRGGRVASHLGEDATKVKDMNDRGWTALDFAAHEGHLKVARMLLDAGADPGLSQPMLWAGQNGYADIVELLLDAGAGGDGKAKGVLSRAVYRNRTEVMNVLLARGVSPAGLVACAAYGARVQGKVEIMRTLIEHGADAAEKDEKGYNALYSQISFYGDGPNRAITEFLLENGAEVDVFNASGLGLISELQGFLAADPGCVSARSGSGLTPLHYAAMGNQMEAAKLLVAAGADKLATVSQTDTDRPVDKVRVTDGHYVTCETEPLRQFLMQ